MMRCDSRVLLAVVALAQLHSVLAQRDVAVSRRKNGDRMPSTYPVTMKLPSPADATRRNAVQDDVFQCRAVKISSADEDEYIVGFSLNNTEQAPLSFAPAILVFGCAELPDRLKKSGTSPLWDCDETCKSGERLLWAFSYEVGSEAFQLPAGSGFWVGGRSNIYYIVLQGKYDLRDKIDSAAFRELEKDTVVAKTGASAGPGAGAANGDTAAQGADAAQRVVQQIAGAANEWQPMVTLTVTRKRPSRLLGVALLENNFSTLRPGSMLAYADASCAFKPPLRSTAQIVAFRVHAHASGRHIAGYMFNGSVSSMYATRGSQPKKPKEYDDYEEEDARDTTHPNASQVFEIGGRDPRLPQVFVPAHAALTVRERDVLLARCTYDTSKRTKPVEFGSRAFDEMCNLFVMYTFDASELYADQYDPETPPQYDEYEEYATLREEADRRDQLPVFVYCARNDFKLLFEQLVPRITSLAQADESQPRADTGPTARTEDVRTDGAFTIESVLVNASRTVAPSDHLVLDTSFRLPESTAARSLSAQLGFTASNSRIGQVCGVATDAANRIYVFHRASLPPTRFLDWLRMPHSPNASASSSQFALIEEDTVAVLEPSGELIESFGARRFALPRAIHVDAFGSIYLADSVQHAVTVFAPAERSTPARVFGAAFLCGPSSIVTDADPESVDQLGLVHGAPKPTAATTVKFVYVADGDCLSVSPSRVVQFAADGSFLAELHSKLPHSVTLAAHALGDALALSAPARLTLHGPHVCVSNRERANVVCWSRRDAALVTALDASVLGDRLVAAPSVGDTFHIVVGTAVYCGAPLPDPHASNRSEKRNLQLPCGRMAGYSVDARTGYVLDVWHAGFDLPVDVACAADGSFVLVAELYPVGTLRKFVYDGGAAQPRTVGDLLAAATADVVAARRDKALPTQKNMRWSLTGVSAFGGALVAFMLILMATCCAVCITCCCRKLRSGGVCGVKLASRRRDSPVKLNVDGEPVIADGSSHFDSGRAVTDMTQMANQVVSKWRVGITDLKDAVSGGGGAPRRGGFAALPQNDSETDEIIDTTCVEQLELGGGQAALGGRVSVNENVRRAASRAERERGSAGSHEDVPSGAHIRFEHSGASKKVRFAVNRNGDVQDGTTA